MYSVLCAIHKYQRHYWINWIKRQYDESLLDIKEIITRLFDLETRKFTHANVKFDEEAGNFKFATITVGYNINTVEEESTVQRSKQI